MVFFRIMLLLFKLHRRFITISLTLAFFCVWSVPLLAQIPASKVKRSHSLSATINSTAGKTFPLDVSGRRHVVGIRVEFQPDSNSYTSGTGTFEEGSLAYLDTTGITIDPLPHNLAYFESHLEFARRYFETVSNNQLDLTYQVSSSIYRLPHSMAYYSPTGEEFTNEPLATLVSDVWQTVDDQGGLNLPNLNQDEFIFLIFHAGVGRDIELTGTTLDKTPQDIPSLFLNQNALSELLDQPNFSGFPLTTPNGQVAVDHSLIIPRTLSRRGEQLGSSFVLQLSTNGLIVASIANQLGLPDLFNTENGSSAIGQFGLMDGAGFFASNGLFPPEPSAWEKWALGWSSVQEYDPLDSPTISLASSVDQRPADVAKVNISRDEYYLVENRYRDPGEDGVLLTIRQPDGSEKQSRITNLNISDGSDWLANLPAGVLIEADHYDWSLPGGLDAGADGELETSDDAILNGGALIWHVDEAVIRARKSENRINADPARRGVDLEEADGAQDIGRTDADQLIGLSATGSPYDFWWSNNNYSVITESDTVSQYQNRFSVDTHPSTANNSGGPTYLELSDFSDVAPTMTFQLSQTGTAEAIAQPLQQYQLDSQNTYARNANEFAQAYPPSLGLFDSQNGNDTLLIVPTTETAYGVHVQATGIDQTVLLNQPPMQPLYSESLVIGAEPQANVPNPNITAWQFDGTQWIEQWNTSIPSPKGFLSTLDQQNIDVDGTREQVDLQSGNVTTVFSAPLQRTPTTQNYQAQISNGQLNIIHNGQSEQGLIQAAGTRLYVGQYFYQNNQPAFFLLTDQSLLLARPDASPFITSLVDFDSISWPAFADMDNDQRIDFLVTADQGTELWGFNHQGSVLNYFPIRAPENFRFWGPPLIADLNSDDELDVIVPATDGFAYALYAYNGDGKLMDGFPLSIGGLGDVDQIPLHPVIDEQRSLLWAVSPQGDLKSWKLPQLGEVAWSGYYGPNTDTNKMGITGNGEPNFSAKRLLNLEETYNWPNPARNETHIRFQVREPADITVKISSLSGRQLKELSYQANGGAPEELRLSTQSFSNGVYYVMIKAESASSTDQHLIKMAIVR